MFLRLRRTKEDDSSVLINSDEIVAVANNGGDAVIYTTEYENQWDTVEKFETIAEILRAKSCLAPF